MLACLVDKHGKTMYPWPFLEDVCFRYEFDLERRKLIPTKKRGTSFFGTESDDKAARDYFDERVGTPEKLMAFSRMGYLDKLELASLLSIETRRVYLDKCFDFEKELTKRCGDRGEPCLASGCSFKETGEACLNAILSSEQEYLTKCAAIWEELFIYSDNRIDVWKR